MKKKWLLDAGHGGVDSQGVYVTAPSKQVIYPDGLTINEGVVNRAIVKYMVDIFSSYAIDFALIYDEVVDLPLSQRISIANKLQNKFGNCVVVSIHCNAGGGSGFEVYTKPGQDESDKLAEPLTRLYLEDYPMFPLRQDRADGDLDKEANFAMVGGNVRMPLSCPAILVENLFMDNRKEAELLIDPAFQQRLAGTLSRWILSIEQIKVL